MLKAILFDLDDTLLGNDIYKFMPPYFASIGRYASQYMDEKLFMTAMQYAANAMMENTDLTISNREIFWAAFGQHTDLDLNQLDKDLTPFYDEDFWQLQAFTSEKPAARKVVEASFQRGLAVVVATNPMFPRKAIEARLAWAGVPVTDFPFTLVTSYENMHATKPHELYYQEILKMISCQPGEALMVGDSWSQDIEPASAAGLFTYWIQLPGTAPEDTSLLSAYGTLDDLYHLVEKGWLEDLGAALS